MSFYLFERRADAHIRKSREYLEDANMKRVEHQAAAEHHNALTKMYAERIDRIESEINRAVQLRSIGDLTIENTVKENLRLQSDSVLIYPSRTAHA